MIEVHQSPDFIDVCILYTQYISIEDSEESIIFKPRSILFNKECKLWELEVELISNNKFDNNEQETYTGSGFSRISPRLH